MAEAHIARAHARLAPSAAYRWMECPGSIAAEAPLPDQGSTYAAEGTAAHELSARCLQNGTDAAVYFDHVIDVKTGAFVMNDLGVELDGVRYFAVDEEMVESVQLYLDTVRSLIPKSGDHELEVEQRLDMTHIHPDISGTGDAVVFQPRSSTLHVVDFKYGRGVAVEPEENPQLLLYGAGAARRYHNRQVRKVKLHVVQPRAPHARGPVRSWETDALSLMEFEDDIRVAAARAMAPDAPRFAGDWCRFCKALPVCPVARERALKVAQSDFSFEAADPMGVGVASNAGEDRTDKAAPSPATLSPDALATVLREAEFIGNWVKAVQAHAHAEAIAGRIPTGFKLVAKRALRRWKDDPIDVYAALALEGLNDDEIYTEREVKSPAQIEKVMGKKGFADIESSMVVKVSSGTNLVVESDVRRSVKSDASADFVEI